MMMNKSSSNFYPKMEIDLDVKEKSYENYNNTIKNLNFESGFKYNNNNYFSNENNKYAINSLNEERTNSGLFRKKCLNNNYKY